MLMLCVFYEFIGKHINTTHTLFSSFFFNFLVIHKCRKGTMLQPCSSSIEFPTQMISNYSVSPSTQDNFILTSSRTLSHTSQKKLNVAYQWKAKLLFPDISLTHHHCRLTHIYSQIGQIPMFKLVQLQKKGQMSQALVVH